MRFTPHTRGRESGDEPPPPRAFSTIADGRGAAGVTKHAFPAPFVTGPWPPANADGDRAGRSRGGDRQRLLARGELGPAALRAILLVRAPAGASASGPAPSATRRRLQAPCL